MNIKHLHLHVRDRAVAEGFYTRWLGLAVARRGSSLTFMCDGDGFDLALMDDATPQDLPPWFHFGCKLAGAAEVVALHARMTAAGVAMAQPLYQDDSFVSFRCRDPDGYAIEVYWETPDAPLD